jgi:hypothetical protein
MCWKPLCAYKHKLQLKRIETTTLRVLSDNVIKPRQFERFAITITIMTWLADMYSWAPIVSVYQYLPFVIRDLSPDCVCELHDRCYDWSMDLWEVCCAQPLVFCVVWSEPKFVLFSVLPFITDTFKYFSSWTNKSTFVVNLKLK